MEAHNTRVGSLNAWKRTFRFYIWCTTAPFNITKSFMKPAYFAQCHYCGCTVHMAVFHLHFREICKISVGYMLLDCTNWEKLFPKLTKIKCLTTLQNVNVQAAFCVSMLFYRSQITQKSAQSKGSSLSSSGFSSFLLPYMP